MFSEATTVLLIAFDSLSARTDDSWILKILFIAGVAILAIGALLLSWRLWTFTILPTLRPDEPREIPYWIPCQ